MIVDGKLLSHYIINFYIKYAIHLKQKCVIACLCNVNTEDIVTSPTENNENLYQRVDDETDV